MISAFKSPTIVSVINFSAVLTFKLLIIKLLNNLLKFTFVERACAYHIRCPGFR